MLDAFLDFGQSTATPPPSALPAAAQPSPPRFSAQLRAVKDAEEDYEWYPTTDEIISALKKDLRHVAISDDRCYGHYRSDGLLSGFLDIGAGNGKVLDAMREWRKGLRDNTRGDVGPFYAIEKSQQLLGYLDPSIYILGCDFWHTSLSDKSVGFIFSNPPYSRFEEWTCKILREAPQNAIIWLLIPQRWLNNDRLQAEMKFRNASTKIIGSYDFEDAEDRKARAKVHLLRITLPAPGYRSGEKLDETKVDPFTRFFNETFTFPEPQESDGKTFDERVEETKVVNRMNFIEALCHLYDLRMEELHRNYQAILDICPDILKEFEISRAGLIESLRMKLATCKKDYWQRLFDGMDEIRSRLTSASREKIYRLMQDQTGIDFNRDNCYAVVMWVVKNANTYFDEQLVTMYETMVEMANVENYVSNKRVFKWERFRYMYQNEKQEATHYRLKVGHRMVLNRCGGLEHRWGTNRGIDERACTFLSDMATVAHNLGFRIIRHDLPREGSVMDSSPFVVRHTPAKGKPESLMRVRVFRNSNLHVQFAPELIHALNVQHGRLKGWLRDDAEAATELEIPAETAARHFTPGFRLTSSALRITAPAA